MDAITIEHLTFAYPDGSPALADVSVRVAPQGSVALIGPNGAGKTTLFLCLAGVLPIRNGTVRVAGLDLASASERKKLPSRLGIIFQNSDDQLFSTTVGDDVAFGPMNLGLPRSDVKRRVTEALGQVGLSGFEDRVPFHLSGGEKRRVALAGVLAMQPEILLLDEPSIFLDGRGRRELIGLLNAWTGTKIIASHDLDLVLDTCQRTLLIDQGRIVADAPTKTLLADSALLDAHGMESPFRVRTSRTT